MIAKAIPDVTGATLLPIIQKHVAPGSTIYTDEYKSYGGIKWIRTRDGEPAKFEHYTINHSSGVYVQGEVHTNSVEGFWKLVKGGIGGVYHSVSRKYLQSYIDEYCFRYNRRHMGNQQFRSLLEQASKQA